ncbi:MAG: DUF3568 family protein [Candidatus Omnitrophota bacterium]|jgi:NH3-dependent NAD+ synthetase
MKNEILIYFKKTIALCAMAIFLASFAGCVYVISGAVDSAETAVWLSMKLTKQVNKPYERTIKATEAALTSLNMKIVKETTTKTITQIKSNYADGKEVWVDIRPLSEAYTRVDVRVGVIGDKEASIKILEKIESYLK